MVLAYYDKGVSLVPTFFYGDTIVCNLFSISHKNMHDIRTNVFVSILLVPVFLFLFESVKKLQ